MKIKIDSNAKINIGLNIVGKLENGYHLLDMTMLPIDLCDHLTIEISPCEGKLTIETNKEDIPIGEDNILYKIYKAFYNKIGENSKEVNIFLEKKIPHQAGLGGGSSNGAIFLKVLNKYHGNPLSLSQLIEVGKKIGADIPFFILNKPTRVTGIGENLEEIENNLDVKLIIIKPKFGVSTQKAYENFKNIIEVKKADINEIIEGLKTNNLKKVTKNIVNNLEDGLLLTDTNIIRFREELEKFSELEFFMSGSGSAYFAFLLKDIQETYSKLQEKFKSCEIYLCNFK